MKGEFTLGLEVEGTLCVRGPVVLNVVSKPRHKAWGSLKHSPGQHIKKGLVNSKPKESFVSLTCL